MKRLLLAFALVGLVAVALPALLQATGAAFVKTADTPQAASGDRVNRWLALEAPGAPDCAPAADTRAEGSDETLALAVGGVPEAGRTLECAFVLRAAATLPEGVERITVTVAYDGRARGAAWLTGLDGSAPGTSATLAAGDARALRLTIPGTAPSTGRVYVTVTFPGETSGFLRYAVPVLACQGDLAACPPAVDEPDDPNPNPNQAGSGVGDQAIPPAGGEATSVQDAPLIADPVVAGTAPSSGEQRRCVSTRRFRITIRAPRGSRVRSARVTVGGKRVAVRRGRRMTALVDLRGRGPGTVRVVVIARTVRGTRLRDVRSYRTCGAAASAPARSGSAGSGT